MINRNEKLNRFFRIPLIMTIFMLGSLSLLGSCSSDDDDEAGGTAPGITAFNFTASNTTLAAEIAAAAMDFFPAFNEITLSVIDTLVNADPVNSPFDLSPLLCTNIGTGSASLSWTDADTSGDLTVGDTAILQFTACDPDSSGETLTGSVSIVANNVVLPASLGFSVSLNIDSILAPDTTTISGNFGFTTTTPDTVNFTNVYAAVDVLGQTITVTENGVIYFKFGCFNVTQRFDTGGVVTGIYNLAPSAVINATDRIMSIASGPELFFINSTMESGTRRLLSVAVPECASIGVPTGVGDSDGSYMDIEALGGGALVLHAFDAQDVEFSTINTTWDALTN